MRAIRVHRPGGPEELRYEECPSPTAGPGEVRIDVKAIGVNYTDIMTRKGANPPPSYPVTPGREAAGVVTGVGAGVTECKVGDQVGYWGVTGSYAEQVVLPERVVVRLPKGVDAKTAAATLLQGMTAHFLVYSVCPTLGKGETALVHAGAGGTGMFLVQLLKRCGVRVFATVSTDEKAAIAREAGADETIVYTREDFARRVLAATDGQGVRIAYDSVGLTTFEGSAACVARRGYLVSYGRSSGEVPPGAVSKALRSSIFVTRAVLGDYAATREELVWRANEVLGLVASGQVTVRIGGVFRVKKAAEAHRLLESRESTGKLVLIP